MNDHDMAISFDLLRICQATGAVPVHWRRVLVLPDDGTVDMFTQDSAPFSEEVSHFIETQGAEVSWRFLTRNPDEAERCLPDRWQRPGWPANVHLGIILDDDNSAHRANDAWWLVGDNGFYLHIAASPDGQVLDITHLFNITRAGVAASFMWVTTPAGRLTQSSLDLCRDASIPVFLWSYDNEEG